MKTFRLFLPVLLLSLSLVTAPQPVHANFLGDTFGGLVDAGREALGAIGDAFGGAFGFGGNSESESSGADTDSEESDRDRGFLGGLFGGSGGSSNNSDDGQFDGGEGGDQYWQYNPSGTNSTDEVVPVADRTSLSAPTGLVATCAADGQSVTLSWNAVAGAEVYPVRIQPRGGVENAVDNVLDTSYTFTIDPDTDYDWWVHAAYFGSFTNASDASGEVINCPSAAQQAIVAQAPYCTLGVTPTVLPAGGGTVTLSWSSNNVADDSTLWIGGDRFENGSPNSGTRVVTIDETTTFRVDVWNDAGFDTCIRTVSVDLNQTATQAAAAEQITPTVTNETVTAPAAEPTLQIGDEVITTDTTGVFLEAADSFLRAVPAGAAGRINNGPSAVGAQWWYRVDYGIYGIGWSAARLLQMPSTAPATAAPVFTDIFDVNSTVTTATAQAYVITVDGVEFPGTSNSLAEVSEECRRRADGNPDATVTCVWGDQVLRGLPTTTTATPDPVNPPTTGTTGTSDTSTPAPATTNDVTRVTIQAGETKTIEVYQPNRYRSARLTNPYGCGSLNTFGIEATSGFDREQIGGLGQPYVTITTNNTVASKTCTYTYSLLNQNNNDAVIHTEVIEVSVVGNVNAAPSSAATTPTASTPTQTTPTSPQTVTVTDTRWNSHGNSYACSSCGQAFCTYKGHGSYVSHQERNAAGESVYGCWDSADPTACAECWKSPWTEDGCNILTEVQCLP